MQLWLRIDNWQLTGSYTESLCPDYGHRRRNRGKKRQGKCNRDSARDGDSDKDRDRERLRLLLALAMPNSVSLFAYID